MPNLTTIGFDADDTLWHNETLFQMTQARFALLLADATDQTTLATRLEAAERRNLGHYGFGVKGFMLSMIETAIEVTEGRVAASVIAEIMEAGRAMLAHPVDLVPQARETIAALAQDYRVLIVTKGDLLDQERKIAQSGLGDLVHGVEIVSHKTPDAYRTIFARHGHGADRSMMVGNSLKSDVIPALEAGAWGIHVPHDLTWALEHAEPPKNATRFRSISDLGQLPNLIRSLHKTPPIVTNE